MDERRDARPHTSYTAVLETLDAPETVLAGTAVTAALGGTAAAVAAVYKSLPLAPAVILGGARSSLFGFAFFCASLLLSGVTDRCSYTIVHGGTGPTLLGAQLPIVLSLCALLPAR